MSEHALLLDQEAQLKLTVGLYEQGLFGIKENPDDYITLKSERLSPHYLDIRPGISDVNTRDLVVQSMIDLAYTRAQTHHNNWIYTDLESVYDHIAGTPEAMTSYAAMIANQLDISLLQPRVDLTKATGNKTPILGRYKEGDKVAEFDDVVTDGASKIATIKGLGKAGLTVVDYFVVVDREEGGAPQVLAETGLAITPVLAVSDMALMLVAENKITNTQFDNVREYIGQYGDPRAKEVLGLAA